MRIPTGIQTVTATASKKSYIKYQCSKCGKIELYEYVLSQQASGSYHTFQSAQTKSNVSNSAGEKASQILDQQDMALFTAINSEHNYDAITQKIKCPHCGEVQPWSNIPCTWRKTKLFWVWIFALILLLYFTLVMGIYFIFPIVLVALLPLLRNIKRKKALQTIQNTSFVPPVYYNRQNINELIAQLKSDNDQ